MADVIAPAAFFVGGVTPGSLESYAEYLLGDPGKTPWLTRDQWETVALLCFEPWSTFVAGNCLSESEFIPTTPAASTSGVVFS